MILADEVVDRRGRLLMPAGRELGERHLDAFRMWGVERIEIEGEGPAEEPEVPFDESVLAEADEKVERLFANAGPDHPFLDALRELARLRMAKRLVETAGGGV